VEPWPRNGLGRWSSYRATIDGFRIGRWVRTQRAEFHRDRLTARRAAQLQALPGWVWRAADHAERPPDGSCRTDGRRDARNDQPKRPEM
jgi:hypothetical protein